MFLNTFGIYMCVCVCVCVYFPGSSVSKEFDCSVGGLGSIPGLGRSLEKEMATHSSILAWRITWTEELGRWQTMGSQRVRKDRVTNTFNSMWFH